MTAATEHSEYWILLRGLIRARFHWGEFPQHLQQALPDSTGLLLPELAGNGERWQEHTPFSVHDMMLDLRRQVQAMGGLEKGPATLVAISMGAMIAAEWARCFPQEVRALRLINTSFSNLSTPWSRMRAPAFFSLLGTFVSGQPLEAAILNWTSNHDQTVLAPYWEAYAQTHPLSLRNALAQLLSASRYRGPLSAPVADVRCYNSHGDRLVNPACTAKIAQRWQVPLISHPDAGHDLPLDDPQWLINELVKSPQ